MQRNGSNRHQTKHNYDMKSTRCPPPLKMLSAGTSKNPDLDIDQKLKKLTRIVLLLMTSAFYEPNLQ